MSEKETNHQETTAENIAEIVARWTGVPVTKMLQSEREKLLHLEDELRRRVAGRQSAVLRCRRKSQVDGASAQASLLTNRKARLGRRTNLTFTHAMTRFIPCCNVSRPCSALRSTAS